MNRKQFLKKAALGLGAMTVLPAALTGIPACGSKPNAVEDEGPCALSPDETAGPFPNKLPGEANIVGDRKGVPLTITLTVLSRENQCQPLPGAFVDIWHCDAHGEYSEYGGDRMQPTDHSHEHYLRGRLTTDKDGVATFKSIYPGWYPGRSPHIHVEVLDKDGKSLRVTQVAFPEDINSAVYTTEHYRGKADTLNAQDGEFSDSLEGNMADTVTGNLASGYGLVKNIVV